VSDLFLDTTFFIDLRRGVREGALSLWEQLQTGEATAAYSPITVYELWVDQRFDREEEVFYEAILDLPEEAPRTSAIAKTAAAWLRSLAPFSEALIRDALIAATAAGHHKPVCTLNSRDFSRFPVQVQSY
jgi:predicted nucleic acid-binding protein